MSPRAKYIFVFAVLGPAVAGAIMFVASRFWIHFGIALCPFIVWIQMLLMHIRCPRCGTSIGFPRGLVVSLEPFFPPRTCVECGADLTAKPSSRKRVW